MVLEQLIETGVQLTDDEPLGAGDLRPEIAASWRRSSDVGLRPDALAPGRDDVGFSGLLRAARTYIETVARDLAETAIAIVVTDDRACVVSRQVSDDLLRRR